MLTEKFLKFFEINMSAGHCNLGIVLLLAVGFAFASIFGYFAHRIKLSPILGYLLAGYLIGPFSPGFVADTHVSEQLAEIGVILMMFGIGLNFKFSNLMSVKRIAIPGAIGQTLIASLCGTAIVYFFGLPLQTGVIMGLAIGVASTVVLVRMLSDNKLLGTKEGHIAVGWLIMEDIITVFILILLPTLALLLQGSEFSLSKLLLSLGIVIAKFIVLAVILLVFGRKFVTFFLKKVIHTQSHELFTISLLALIFLLAVGSTFIFGISIALGAFIAGMIIGQTEERDQALSHSRPMKDAFIAVFFLSVGMLFNPLVIVNDFPLFISILGVILIVKPLAAFAISALLKYPLKTSLIVAAALSQIGEFSFILSEEAMKYDLIPDEGYDLIVSCALVSIAINPLVFKLLHKRKEVS